MPKQTVFVLYDLFHFCQAEKWTEIPRFLGSYLYNWGKSPCFIISENFRYDLRLLISKAAIVFSIYCPGWVFGITRSAVKLKNKNLENRNFYYILRERQELGK